MSPTRFVPFLLLIFTSLTSEAQTDSALQTLQQLPTKYINQVDNKIDQYSNRITNKTEKTLTKLSRWENKIKTLLEKASPETVQKLFGNNQLTFAALLEKYKQGKAAADNYHAQYDSYRDKLNTSINYLIAQKDKLDNKYIQPAVAVKEKVKKLDEQVENIEAVEQYIKERKKQLLEQSMQYLGKSKYLTKINKEAYYYVETIRNYKQLFSDKKRAEETALKILNKIPAFNEFFKKNSLLSSMFSMSGNSGAGISSFAGLQSRASVSNMIQTGVASSGPNAIQAVQQKIQQAQSELGKLKDKVNQYGGGGSDSEIPDFKPNSQKSKTLFQRLDYSTNIQFAKPNGYLPTSGDFAFNIGYKINDKSVVGIGASYKAGFGNIERIKISHMGIGLRSFLDWKLKKQLFVSGGYEQNYLSQFKSITQLKNNSAWQASGLIGLNKKMNIKTKWFKGTNVQVLYDFLYNQHLPQSQPLLFRIGYSFK